ncbi:MAG TPA: hypothetical protein VFV19_19510 [Candidatus Polarisedimenticolaceae bacterium]|nr:hypothetical protein [Candidatus Polarisedimenticolaceae bacterium]
MAKSKLAARPPLISNIAKHLDSIPRRTLSEDQLHQLMFEHGQQWRLGPSFKFGDLVEALSDKGLRIIRLRSRSGRVVTRYAWRNASEYGVALSLYGNLYLSHLSAMVLHDLTDQVPSVMYVNREQSPKPSQGRLTQSGIDLAFSRPARESQLVYEFEGRRITVLSGKSSGRLEVGRILVNDGEELAATNIERTLVDIVVRPNYSGGVPQVLAAFERARSRISVNVLVATLRKLAHVYPYHQAIGFFMSRAGYSEQQLALLRQFPVRFKFYVAHGMRQPDFDSAWRVYYPKGL